MENDSFISLNPSSLSDKAVWSYNDLKKLSASLGLSGSGKREDLVTRLFDWHKERSADGTSKLSTLSCQGQVEKEQKKKRKSLENENEWLALNVMGSNFSLLPQHIVVNAKSPIKRRRSSLLDVEERSPTLLKPLMPYMSPSKSILKVLTPGTKGQRTSSSSCLKFSPYNGTKIIGNRTPDDETFAKAASPDEEDIRIDKEEEHLGYVDEEARRNAERNMALAEDQFFRSSF